MSCDSEKQNYQKEMKEFSRAWDDVNEAALNELGASLATMGSGGYVVMQVAALASKANVAGLAVGVVTFVGSWFWMESAEEGVEQAAQDYAAAEIEYKAAKKAYDECVLSSLPADTG